MKNRSILKNKNIKRNIVNISEIEETLLKLKERYPEAKDYIEKNVKNYLYRDAYYLKASKLNKKDQKTNDLIKEETHQVLLTKEAISELGHCLDFWIHHGKPRVSVKELMKKTFFNDEKRKFTVKEVEGLTETYFEHEYGNRIVKLLDHQAAIREGWMMRHCVADYWDLNESEDYLSGIFSLRDKDNKPLITMYLQKRVLVEIKGFANREVEIEREEEIVQFIQKYSLILKRDGRPLITINFPWGSWSF